MSSTFNEEFNIQCKNKILKNLSLMKNGDGNISPVLIESGKTNILFFSLCVLVFSMCL